MPIKFSRVFSLTGIVLALASCSRDMTEGEIEYSQDILTRNLDFSQVSFVGWASEKAKAREAFELMAREDELADRFAGAESMAASLPGLFGADALTIGNKVFFDQFLWDFSTSIYEEDRWLMAHELVHVWQWQNRDRLGYSFSKIIAEHIEFGDEVYEYSLKSGKRFTEYRFEQQGQIVQCFAQLRFTHPNDPATERHRQVIRAEFPLDQVMDFVGEGRGETIRVRADGSLKKCKDRA